MINHLKIIHITASYKPAYIYGGPIQSVGKLCEAIAEKAQQNGIDVEVFTTTANGSTELKVETEKPIRVDGVLVTYFKRWTKDHSHFSPGLLWKLRKEILKFKSSASKGREDLLQDKLIIHIHAWWNLVSVFSCLMAKWYKIPVLLSPRGMLTGYTQNNRNSLVKHLIHNLIGKSLLAYCHIHTTSEQETKDVGLIIQPKSITVIHNLVDIPKRMNHLAQNTEIVEVANPLKMIFLSRIEEKKGLILLFDALAILETPWTLTIAGSGTAEYLESLKQITQTLKLNDRIKWIGQVLNEDKFELMAKHDLLVLPSYNENFANVVIESLSVGTPVLISDQVGLSDYVQEKKLGWVTSLHPAEIQKSLSSAADHYQKRQFIRQQAPIIIANDFKDTNLVQKYLHLYQNIVN